MSGIRRILKRKVNPRCSRIIFVIKIFLSVPVIAKSHHSVEFILCKAILHTRPDTVGMGVIACGGCAGIICMVGSDYSLQHGVERTPFAKRMCICHISTELVRVVFGGIIKIFRTHFCVQTACTGMRISISRRKGNGIFIVQYKIPVAAIGERVDSAGRILRIINMLGYRRQVFNKTGAVIARRMVETCADNILNCNSVGCIECLESRPVKVFAPFAIALNGMVLKHIDTSI